MLLTFSRQAASSPTASGYRNQVETEIFAVSTCKQNPDLLEASIAVEDEAWEQVGYLDYTNSHDTYYHRMAADFPEYRLSMYDVNTGEVVATGVCLPVNFSELSDLPQEGWDWAVQTAFEQRGGKTDGIVALSVSVAEAHRHRGFARDLINSIRQFARIKYCTKLVVPVRPNLKFRYPQVSISDYITWQDDRGRIFDPWLRSHIAVGGEVVGVCERSMVVVKPIEFWRDWVREEIRSSGSFHIDGALSPLIVDFEDGIGSYIEPNVWIKHQI